MAVRTLRYPSPNASKNRSWNCAGAHFHIHQQGCIYLFRYWNWGSYCSNVPLGFGQKASISSRVTGLVFSPWIFWTLATSFTFLINKIGFWRGLHTFCFLLPSIGAMIHPFGIWQQLVISFNNWLLLNWPQPIWRCFLNWRGPAHCGGILTRSIHLFYILLVLHPGITVGISGTIKGALEGGASSTKFRLKCWILHPKGC